MSMMLDKFILCIILLVVTSNANELNSNEIEAQQFALETSEKIFKFYDEISDNLFKNNPNIFFNTIDRRQSILNESRFLVDIVEQAKKFDIENFKDNELSYAFEKITKLADEKIIGGEQYAEIFDVLDKVRYRLLRESYFHADECDYSIKYGILRWVVRPRIPIYSDFKRTKDVPVGTIRPLMSNDLKTLQFYWSEDKSTTGYWAGNILNLTVKRLQDAANLSDVSPLEFWMRQYNLTEIENLMTAIQPLYMELHAFIRNRLLNKYGDSVIKSDGLIPHHLIELLTSQIWTNSSIIEELFPYDNLPSSKFVPGKIFNTMGYADVFYQKLGFKEFPNEIWKDHIKSKKADLTYNKAEENGCSTVIYYSSPKVNLEFCEELNFKQFLESYSDLGKLYYAKEMTGLPAYFFSTYDLEYAIGKAAILSASTHSNLKDIGVIVEFDNKDEVEMNRLLRKSIESLLNLAVEFVHIKLTADILSGNVDRKEVNNKYWDLMDKYIGVERPVKEKSGRNNLDMSADFYYDMNDNAQSRKFNSEILSYQIYKKLCELSGKFPKESLHLCDIFGSKAAGDALKNMMRLGSSKPFNEILATMFPENPTINAEGILEYYSPVRNFLLKKNSEANVKPGWKHSDEDISGESESSTIEPVI